MNRHIFYITLNNIDYFLSEITDRLISFTKRDAKGKLLDVPKSIEYIVDEKTQTIKFDGVSLTYQQFSYIYSIMNKNE